MTAKMSAELSLEEMEQIVDEHRQIEFWRARSELEQEKRELRARAPAVLDLLRQHLPADVRREVEDYLSSGWGVGFLRDALEEQQTQVGHEAASEVQSEDPFGFERPGLWPE